MQKLAIITGSSYGIGKALAKILLDNNFQVYGYSRTNSIVHKNFTFIQADLSDTDSVNIIKLPQANASSSVILINNAATIGKISPINQKSNNDILYEYNLNLIAPVLISKKVIDNYIQNNKLIINISSGAAIKSISGWATYCSSKAAMDSFTLNINEEEHNNLRAISIYPGIVNTKMQENIRKASSESFPLLNKFKDYFTKNELAEPRTVAKRIYEIIANSKKYRSNIIDIRNL